MGDFKKFVQFAKEYRPLKYNPTSRLKSTDEILTQLEKEIELVFHQNIFPTWNYDYVFEKSRLEIIYNIGLELCNSGNNDDAKEIFEILNKLIGLKITQIERESSNHPDFFCISRSFYIRPFIWSLWVTQFLCYLIIHKVHAIKYIEKFPANDVGGQTKQNKIN